MNSLHYCSEHQTKFYKNEKIDPVTGETKVWYSHKKADGSGFCTEKENNSAQLSLIPAEKSSNQLQSIFACNAMNNSVALAAAGRIHVNQVDEFYRKILAELTRS